MAWLVLPNACFDYLAPPWFKFPKLKLPAKVFDGLAFLVLWPVRTLGLFESGDKVLFLSFEVSRLALRAFLAVRCFLSGAVLVRFTELLSLDYFGCLTLNTWSGESIASGDCRTTSPAWSIWILRWSGGD
jgi:hypothetical protein